MQKSEKKVFFGGFSGSVSAVEAFESGDLSELPENHGGGDNGGEEVADGE